MTFTNICVGLVITILITVISGSISSILSLNSSRDNILFYAWITSSIGFGVCLTIILYQSGIIK